MEHTFNKKFNKLQQTVNVYNENLRKNNIPIEILGLRSTCKDVFAPPVAYGVNWSALGTVSTAEATDFLNELQTVISRAKYFTTNVQRLWDKVQ